MPSKAAQRKGGNNTFAPVDTAGTAVVAAQRLQRTVAVDQSVQDFLQGLSSVNAAIGQYVQKRETADMQAGAAARAAGMTGKEKAGAAWQEGFMKADAALSADRDGMDLIEGWKAGQADGIGVERFIELAYRSKTKGMPDDEHKAAYDTAFANRANKLRELDYDKRTNDTILKAEGDTQTLVDTLFKSYTDRTGPDDLQQRDEETDAEYALRQKKVGLEPKYPSAAELDALYKHAKSVGVDGKRFNAMLLATANTYGNRGAFELYEALKQDRPDGTPSLYRIPEFKRAIDEGQQMAEGVYTEFKRKQALELKAQREQRREDMLQPIYIQYFADGDIDGATKNFYAAVKANPGLFKADDIHKHAERLRRADAREETAKDQDTTRDLLVGIYTGKTKWHHIIGANLPLRLQKTLIDEWQQRETRLKAQGDDTYKNLERWSKSPQVDGYRTSLRDLDRGFQPMMALDETKANALRAARNSVLHAFELAAEQAGLKGGDEEALAKAYKRAVDAFEEATKDYREDPAKKSPMVTSRNRRHARDRYANGEIPEGQFDFENGYFQRHPQHETK